MLASWAFLSEGHGHKQQQRLPQSLVFSSGTRKTRFSKVHAVCGCVFDPVRGAPAGTMMDLRRVGVHGDGTEPARKMLGKHVSMPLIKKSGANRGQGT